MMVEEYLLGGASKNMTLEQYLYGYSDERLMSIF
jgi:hypothetical protein